MRRWLLIIAVVAGLLLGSCVAGTPPSPTPDTIIPQLKTLVVAAKDSPAADKAKADFVGDGADDQVEIQKAVNLAGSAGGGTVLLLPGTYILGDVIDLMPNIKLIGQGDLTVLKVKNNLGRNSSLLRIPTAMSNVEISNLALDGNKSNNEGFIITGIEAQPLSKSLISNIWIKDFTNHGIELVGSYDNKIVGVRVTGSNVGVSLLSFSYRNVIIGNVAEGNITGFSIASDSYENTITGNLAKNNSASGFSLCSAYRNTISNNTAIGNEGAGLRAQDNSEYNIITNNIFNGGLDGIILTTTGTYEKSRYNTIEGNTATGNSRYGIFLQEATGNQVKRNDLRGNKSGNMFGTGNIVADNILGPK